MGFLARTSMAMLAVGLVGAHAQVADRATAVAIPLDTELQITPQPPAGQAEPRILNDTPEFCQELRADIDRIRARRGEMPENAAVLTREGERMCRIGHFRPGIFRLRTALMMLRRGE